jgi:hypothetical protein
MTPEATPAAATEAPPWPVVVVGGPPGIGKSTLIERLQQRGLECVEGSANPYLGRTSYRVLLAPQTALVGSCLADLVLRVSHPESAAAAHFLWDARAGIVQQAVHARWVELQVGGESSPDGPLGNTVCAPAAQDWQALLNDSWLGAK